MNEADFQLIEDAIRGQLSPEKDRAFKLRMESDPEFKRQYEEVDLMIRSIKSVAAERMIRDASRSSSPGGRSISWPTARVVALAASILLVLAAGIWLLNRQSDDLAGQFYTPYAELSISQPRGGQTLYEIKVRALDYYRLHQVAAALQTLDSAFAIDPTDEESLMLTGLCRLEESSYKKALEAFQKIADFQGQGPALQWYTALAHVGLGQHEEARALLKTVRESGSATFAPKAAALERRLFDQ